MCVGRPDWQFLSVGIIIISLWTRAHRAPTQVNYKCAPPEYELQSVCQVCVSTCYLLPSFRIHMKSYTGIHVHKNVWLNPYDGI